MAKMKAKALLSMADSEKVLLIKSYIIYFCSNFSQTKGPQQNFLDNMFAIPHWI